jgi:hypothetical protein
MLCVLVTSDLARHEDIFLLVTRIEEKVYSTFFSDTSINHGIYLTQSMWNSITGGYRNALPVGFPSQYQFHWH